MNRAKRINPPQHREGVTLGQVILLIMFWPIILPVLVIRQMFRAIFSRAFAVCLLIGFGLVMIIEVLR